MPTKTRIIIVSIFILLGAALFCYCAVFYPTMNTVQAKSGSTAFAGSETSNANATSIGDAKQDKSGQINPTRSERRSRPQSGAT